MNENKNKKLKIDVYSMVQDVFRNIPYIICTGVAFALIAYMIVNSTYVPNYTVETTFSVSAKGTTNSVYNNFATATSMSEMFERILNSPVLREKVSESVGENVSLDNVKAYRVPETNLLTLSVSAEKPDKAYKIMNAVLDNYGNISEYMLGNAIMEILDPPQMPMAPDNYVNDRGAMKNAFLIGVVLMIAITILLSYFRDTVKSSDEIEEKLEGKLLGVIWLERKKKTVGKKKTSILMDKSTSGFRFVESYKKLATKLDYKCKKDGHKVIMCTSVLTNEGKSTVAANIALALAKRKKNVLLLDCDLRKSAQHLIFDYKVPAEKELSQYLDGKAEIEDIIIDNTEHNIKMVCNTKSQIRSNEILVSEKIKKLFEYGREHMDYVIVDTPPMAMVADVEIISDLSDTSLMVVRKNFALTRDINDATDVLKASKADYLGYVYNAEINFAQSVVSKGRGYGYGYGYGYGSRYGRKDKTNE